MIIKIFLPVNKFFTTFKCDTIISSNLFMELEKKISRHAQKKPTDSSDNILYDMQ